MLSNMPIKIHIKPQLLLRIPSAARGGSDLQVLGLEDAKNVIEIAGRSR